MKTMLRSAFALGFASFLFSGIANAQTQLESDTMGTITLSVDSRVDVLADKQSKINKLAVHKNANGYYKGFRIMVLNTSDRNLANKAKADILRYFPGVKPYLAYQTPFFKLRAGNFLKREDAEKVRRDMAKHFKDQLYVVNDLIELTPEEEARLLNESNLN